MAVVARGSDPLAGSGADAVELEFLTLPDMPEELRLGIDESDARTDTWVGFRDSTPHAARRSEVEQSAMTPEPGGGPQATPTAAATPSENLGPATPTEAAAVTVEAAAPSQGIESPEARPAPSRVPVLVTNVPPDVIAPMEATETADQPQEPITLPEEWAEFPEFDPQLREPAPEAPTEPVVETPAERTAISPESADPPRSDGESVDDRASELPAIGVEPSDAALFDAAPSSPEAIEGVDPPGIEPDLLLAQMREQQMPESIQSDTPDPFAFLLVPLIPPQSLPPDDPGGVAAESPAPETDEAADQPPLESPESMPTPPAPQASREDAGDGQAPQASRGNPGGAGTPGERSESEASATALEDAIEVRPGRVVAAEGLQITTVRPVFAIATMVMTSPRSPTVVIEFGGDGRVRRATYVEGQSTGSRDVDLPLLDAIYRWTARGKALESLAGDPDATISIRMRILLR